MRNPLLCDPALSVAVATAGLTLVHVEDGSACKVGSWLVVHGFRLGQVKSVVGNVALVHVHSNEVMLGPPEGAERVSNPAAQAKALNLAQKGARLESQQEWKKAAKVFDKASDLVGTSLVTRASLKMSQARCWMRMNKWEKVMHCARAATEIVATDADSHFCLAQAYSMLKRFSEAKSEMDKVLGICPLNDIYLQWLGKLRGQTRDAAFMDRRDLDPKSFAAVNTRSQIERFGRDDGLENNFTVGSWSYFRSEMERLMYLEQHRDALAFGEECLRAGRDNACVIFNLGVLYGQGFGMAKKNEKRAMELFRQAAALPDDGPPDAARSSWVS